MLAKNNRNMQEKSRESYPNTNPIRILNLSEYKPYSITNYRITKILTLSNTRLPMYHTAGALPLHPQPIKSRPPNGTDDVVPLHSTTASTHLLLYMSHIQQ